LSEMTEGFVGSDIESVCREAGMNALRNDIESDEATMEDFKEAIDEVRPTATEDNLEQYRAMTQKMNEMEKTEEETPD
ncbi:MAG: ATPase, partial [Candidatus Nanohalobium sp.]